MVGLGSDFYARAKASISRYTSVPHSLSYLGFQNGGETDSSLKYCNGHTHRMKKYICFLHNSVSITGMLAIAWVRTGIVLRICLVKQCYNWILHA
jgi:hypothetical protein